jgi:hypothetical protein
VNQYPDTLYHYYEANRGPLVSLSDLSLEDAEGILAQIRRDGLIFASRRSNEYLQIRRELEERIRSLFVDKGGQPRRARPHYFILGSCPWVKSWYVDGCEIRIPLAAVDPQVVSFTYGDSFPAMRYQDGKLYRGQVYTLEELPGLVEKYGLPQTWNPDGAGGPERYIEAQVWDDEPVRLYLGTEQFRMKNVE